MDDVQGYPLVPFFPLVGEQDGHRISSLMGVNIQIE